MGFQDKQRVASTVKAVPAGFDQRAPPLVMQDLALATLREARQTYESDPRVDFGFHAFGFRVNGQRHNAEVISTPITVSISDDSLEYLKHHQVDIGNHFYHLIVRHASAIPSALLLGIGVLRLARGIFPRCARDLATATMWESLGLSGKIDPPWPDEEGVCFTLDTPYGRESWACLRPVGEWADPCGEPERVYIEARDIPRMYPEERVSRPWTQEE